MKQTNKKNYSKSAIAFYILAGLTFLVFVYSMYNVQIYLSSAIDQGQISWAANWFDLIGYYTNTANGFVYLLYAAILAGMGYVISLIKQNKNTSQNGEEVFVEETSNDREETIIEEMNEEETKA